MGVGSRLQVLRDSFWSQIFGKMSSWVELVQHLGVFKSRTPGSKTPKTLLWVKGCRLYTFLFRVYTPEYWIQITCLKPQLMGCVFQGQYSIECVLLNPMSKLSSMKCRLWGPDWVWGQNSKLWNGDGFETVRKGCGYLCLDSRVRVLEYRIQGVDSRAYTTEY